MVTRRTWCASWTRCGELVEPPERYCSQHRGEGDRRRASAPARGYDEQWRTRRRAYLLQLAATDPDGAVYCENCGKRHERVERSGKWPRWVADDGHAIEVDHIDGRGPLGDNSDANLQPLCRSCHQRKTALQTGTGGRT